MLRVLRTLLSRELIGLGLADLRAHKLRSFLTAMGMIFGVGAVICMLAIGEGASAEQLDSLKMLGSDNIIVRSVEPPNTNEAREANTSVKRYGLIQEDIDRLREIRNVDELALMRNVADEASRGSRRFDGSIFGVTPNLFDVIRLELASGRYFADMDAARHHKVCIVGAHVADALFAHEDPLGQTINVVTRSTGPVPYVVVGVLKDRETAGTPAKGVGARNVNAEIYIPFETADIRYGNVKYTRKSGQRELSEVEFSEAYVHVANNDDVLNVARNVAHVLRHDRRREDYKVIVPLELLKQAEQTARIWQITLASIAGISLLVGGIGIMNIMLASVTERTREIGIRRALGAKRYHITAQFLVETLMLSIGGGILGIVGGIALAKLVTFFAGFETIVPLWGVLLSFIVSATVGVCFGLYPARAAAELDPIEALRYE